MAGYSHMALEIKNTFMIMFPRTHATVVALFPLPKPVAYNESSLACNFHKSNHHHY